MDNVSSSSDINNKIINNNLNLNKNEDVVVDDYVLAVHAVLASFMPMVLHAAVELNLFDIIAKAGPGKGLTVTEIASQLSGCRNPDAPSLLDRMLRLLATHSLVSSTLCTSRDGGSEKRYGLSPASKFFVADENGASLGPLLALHIDPVIQLSWSKLKESVLEGGIPFNMVHGLHAFEYPASDPRFNQVFNDAMFKQPSFTTLMMLHKFKVFEDISTLVDVGGSLGHTLRIIVSKYPTMKGINFDLPHVIRAANPYPGVEHIGGNMFESVPQGDAILMKWVLQIWDDEHCIKLLENCYKSIPKNGKVIVMEEMLTDEPETTMIAKVVCETDAYSMIKNPGGRCRTLNDIFALAKSAGFDEFRFIGNVAEVSVVQFGKH